MRTNKIRKESKETIHRKQNSHHDIYRKDYIQNHRGKIRLGYPQKNKITTIANMLAVWPQKKENK